MYSGLKSMAGRAVALLGTGLMLCTGVASAQTFEWHYGNPGCLEGGRSVVPVTKESGYIAVGNTQGEICGSGDIYVVRTHNHGQLAWSTTYDIGGIDIATSVKEVLNDPKGEGGFIITGLTANDNSSCDSRMDAFLLRIDRCGKVLWVKGYGHTETTEFGGEVVEATTGDAERGTSAGDFIVAGWSTYEATTGHRNGYIFRTSSTGNLIWDQVYEGPERLDDYFYSVDEAKFGNSSGSSTGDIVAAGGTSSYDLEEGTEGWIVRVDGNSGEFIAPQHTAVAYGLRGFEEFRSIRELKILEQGALVATGVTTSINGAEDVYVVETKPNPCDFVADRIFGDYGRYPDEGFAVRETNIDGLYYEKGYIVITGFMHAPPGLGHGGEDVFLQILKPGGLDLVPECRPTLYGGDGHDRGLSVEPLTDDFPCRSKGFVVTGFTESRSIIGSDPGQLYLIKTTEELKDNCEEKQYGVKCEVRNWQGLCRDVRNGPIAKHCDTKTEPVCVTWSKERCFERLGTDLCKLDPCEPCPPDGAKRLTGASESMESGVASLSSFPNPVKSGSAITLEYTLLKDGMVTITVSDLSGRTVYNSSTSGKSGVATTAVGTEGWTSGSYMVSVSAGGKATTTRIVVTE